MYGTAEKRYPSTRGEPVVAGAPLSHYLTGTSDQTNEAAGRLTAHFTALKALLARLEALVVPERQASVSELLNEVEGFRTQVSLIGQVKAGKTMLTNALTGMPGMLPSDVNPWTSVVTSIHINTPKPRGTDAVFTFYTPEDWAGLTTTGGRLGELARRADFESELDEMRQQVSQMQARTEARLGVNFGLLLGSQHRFKGFNAQLLEKYVCLGENPEPGEASGRYADVTKAADLYIDSSDFGLPATISDTPGVNDPFLARERATLATLAKTDVCVIVLSAHQAFSTVDLALMRVMLALEAEQIILFVNRIDELEDPDTQIREIDAFVRDILKSKGLSARVPIVYGSAAWADLALRGIQYQKRNEPALARLQAFVEARVQRDATASAQGRLVLGQPPYSTDKLRDLSGLHELRALLAHKSTMNVGAPFAAEALLRGLDLANQSALLLAQLLENDMPLRVGLDMNAMIERIRRVQHEVEAKFPQIAKVVTDRMLMKMSVAFREFIERESVVLREALVSGVRTSNWTPDAEALRSDLNRAYHAFVAEMNADLGSVYASAAKAIKAVYADLLDDSGQLFDVRPPRLVEPKAPATLMRTMSFDMKTSWLGSWLAKATGPEPVVHRFTDAVMAEMVDILDELRDGHVLEHVARSQNTLLDFLAGHLETLQELAAIDGPARGNEARQKLGIESEAKRRMASLRGLMTEFQSQVDLACADFRLSLT